MLAISIVGLLGLVGSVAADCARDDCLRQVIASAFATRHGVADCSAYFAGAPPVTYTPPPVTVTTTRTIATTKTTTTAVALRRRNVRDVPEMAEMQENAAVAPRDDAAVVPRQAPTIPAYASSCLNPSQYSTACSCLGVFATVTTVPPTKTATTRVTATITSTSVLPKPTLIIHQYLYGQESCAAADQTEDVIASNNACAYIGDSTKIRFGSYTVPPGCTCSVTFYTNSFDCTTVLQAGVDPTSTDCFDANPIYGATLFCNC